MSKIKLLLLEGCQRCQKLKEELGKNYVYYEYEICKSDTEICDSIEDLIGCSNYPIVLKIINNNFIEEVIYITDNYDDVGITKSLNNKIKGKPIHSIDQLIDYVIKL
jgi:glutaredoxin-related protein